MMPEGMVMDVPSGTGLRPGLAALAGPVCVQDDCRLFGALLNEMPEGVLVVDDAGVIVFANLAMNVLFLPLPLEVGGRLGNAAALEPVARLVDEVRRKRMRVEGELRLPKVGEWSQERHYHLSASPWYEGGSHGVWVMVEDRTEREVAEHMSRDFVTNAGHELRTPLSLIHGYIETLKSGMIKNTTSLVRCLDVMEKHSRRMMRIIEDMLMMSRLDALEEPLKLDTFLVRGCVQDALEHLTPLVELRQPVITLDFPPDGGLLRGDRFYWDQIFTHLIENPLKENARTGLKLTLRGRWSLHECVLTVEDDGVGIAPADVPLVFNRFYRCVRGHAQEPKGTGLGLSIVKRAVEAHGGTIELESRTGERTLFTIRVPIQEE